MDVPSAEAPAFAGMTSKERGNDEGFARIGSAPVLSDAFLLTLTLSHGGERGQLADGLMALVGAGASNLPLRVVVAVVVEGDDGFVWLSHVAKECAGEVGEVGFCPVA